MTRRLGLILAAFSCASVLGAEGTAVRPKPSDPRAARLAEIDQNLARYEAIVLDLEGQGKPDGLLGQCLSRFDPDVAARSAGHGGLQTALVNDELYQFLRCQAYASKNPALCLDLGERFAPECQRSYGNMSLAQAIISGRPDAESVCQRELGRATSSKENGGNLGGQESRICGVVLAGGDAESICAKLSTMFQKPFDRAEMADCRIVQGSLRGEAAACAQANRPGLKSQCADFSAYRKAFAAKSEKACGQSLNCRLMMGTGSCASLGKKAAKGYCRKTLEGDLYPLNPVLDRLLSTEDRNTPPYKTRSARLKALRSRADKILKRS